MRQSLLLAAFCYGANKDVIFEWAVQFSDNLAGLCVQGSNKKRAFPHPGNARFSYDSFRFDAAQRGGIR